MLDIKKIAQGIKESKLQEVSEMLAYLQSKPTGGDGCINLIEDVYIDISITTEEQIIYLFNDADEVKLNVEQFKSLFAL